MKHNFRIVIGMLLFAIPLCLNAQVKPVRPEQEPKKAKVEKVEKEKLEKEKLEKEKFEKKEHKGGPFNSEMLKFSGFVQGMYQANLSDEGELTSNTFRMRRVRLSVDGNLSKTVSYKIQGDFTRSPMLVDAYVKYKPCREFAIQVGQFKTPFTLESPINPVNLEIFDYGESVQQLVGYKDVCGVGALGRDLGIMATGSLFPVIDEDGYKYSIVDYAVGVFNGNGANQLDNNNRKDLVGRLEVHPGLKALTLSSSYYYGKYLKNEDYNGVRNRWSAGVQYNDGNLVIRGEYLSGNTGYQGFEGEGAPNQFNSKGYYAVAGYNFKFGKEGKEQKLMPVLRYEHFEQQTGVFGAHTADHVIYMLPDASAPTSYYTVGINYWPLKSVNFKLDYSLIDGSKKVDNHYEDNYLTHRVVGILSYKF
jgi:hypothetical protein